MTRLIPHILAVISALNASLALAECRFYGYENDEGTLIFSDEPPLKQADFKVFEVGERKPPQSSALRMARHELRRLIHHHASQAGLDPLLVEAVVRAESAFDPMAVSRKGAAGLMQLMPATAQELGVDNVFNPSDNLWGGSRHLRRLLNRYERLDLALAAYNAGEAAVARYGGIPPFVETIDYVEKVRNYYDELRERSTYTASGSRPADPALFRP